MDRQCEPASAIPHPLLALLCRSLGCACAGGATELVAAAPGLVLQDWCRNHRATGARQTEREATAASL